MAIHVSDRNLSRLQYEDSYRKIWGAVRKKMDRVPKRRRNTVARPLMRAMNAAFETILCIEEDPVRGTKTAAGIRYARIVEAQKRIKQIEKPLWAYWNICSDEEEYALKEWQPRQRANLCDEFNAVLKLLHDMQASSCMYEAEKDVGLTTMRYYTEAEIEKAVYLRTIRDLHRMTHGKVIRLNAITRDAEADLLLRFIDTAWYCAVTGNQMRPDRAAEAKIRKTALSTAISSLNKMQRPLFSLFSIGSYSNREMEEWSNLLNESIRLLAAVLASDRKRGG